MTDNATTQCLLYPDIFCKPVIDDPRREQKVLGQHLRIQQIQAEIPGGSSVPVKAMRPIK